MYNVDVQLEHFQFYSTLNYYIKHIVPGGAHILKSHYFEVKVEVTLRLTVNQSVCFGVGHPMTRFYFFLSFAGKLLCSSFGCALPDERTGL
jgi:hypothetical protein